MIFHENKAYVLLKGRILKQEIVIGEFNFGKKDLYLVDNWE